MTGPGLFSDIGKRAKDLLTKDYNRDQKLTVSTVTTSGFVIFRGTCWTCFWSLRQKEEDHPKMKTARKLLETAAMEIFTNNGWRFTNRITS